MKIRPIFAILACLSVIIGFAVVSLGAETRKSDVEEMQLSAAVRMENAETYLKARILEKGIQIEPEDLNETALIGPEFTELTSTPGEIGAKRSSLNPAFAAAMIRYYKDAGLKRGDTIAIGSSGSFPGFIIAVLTSATEYGLKANVMASLGASTHGATRIDFNVFDFLQQLKDGGFADFDLVAISCGGENDAGGGVGESLLYDGSTELSIQICREYSQRTSTIFIHEESLADNIQKRLDLYGDDIKMFINIGGASVNSGKSSYTLDFPHGLVVGGLRIPSDATRGLNYEYLSRGIPVLNLLSVKLLCRENNIPFDPVPMPGAMDAPTMEGISYDKTLIVMTILITALIIAIGVFDRKEGYNGVARILTAISLVIIIVALLSIILKLCPYLL